jgi:uncharacterized protein YciI
MIYAVIFEDNQGMEHLRQLHMQDHLAFLSSQSGVLGAGPLFLPNGAGHGGMWSIEADGLEDVEAMLGSDPFHNTGLRKSISILEWRQVMRDGRRTG